VPNGATCPRALCVRAAAHKRTCWPYHQAGDQTDFLSACRSWPCTSLPGGAAVAFSQGPCREHLTSKPLFSPWRFTCRWFLHSLSAPRFFGERSGPLSCGFSCWHLTGRCLGAPWLLQGAPVSMDYGVSRFFHAPKGRLCTAPRQFGERYTDTSRPGCDDPFSPHVALRPVTKALAK